MLLLDFYCKENDGTISFLGRTIHKGLVTSDYGVHEVGVTVCAVQKVWVTVCGVQHVL